MFAVRRERLLAELQREGLDAVLITNPVNVSYLSGFSGDATFLVISPRRTLVISDGRFTEQLAEECPGLETVIRPPVQPLGDATAATLNKLGIRTLGFESEHVTVADLEFLKSRAPTLDWQGAGDRVERLRIIKDDSEVAQIRQAIRYAEKAFAMFRAMLRPDDREKDLADSLEYYMRRAGARGPSFPSIVAVGARAALPHAPPTPRRVAEAPLLLVDWGASGPFYKSDLTRVLLTHNNSPATTIPKIEEVYATVLQAQRQAIAAVRPGALARQVDAAARQVIADAGYGQYFTHSVGHGIGMMIHEAPFMRANTEIVLRAGMVVTVEPGIYLPDVAGIRIEDDVLVTADGCEVLTSVPKNIEAAHHEF